MAEPTQAVQAPQTPANESTAESEAFDPREAVLSSTLKDMLSPEDGEATDENVISNAAGERIRDPLTGKFVASDTKTGAESVPGVEEVPGEETPVVEVPEGYALAQPLAAEKAAGFKVRDAEGEIIPPDWNWELTANGKPRTLSTDKLVAYAQMGVYNHEREQAFEQQQQQSTELQSTVQQYEQAYREQAQTIERLLSDPEYAVASMEEYARNNTPEARAERDRRALETEREQMALQRMEQGAEQFISSRLEPALDMIAESLPTISREELAAKLIIAADRYRVNGVLRPEGFAPISQYVATDLLAWAQQVHEHRESERQAPVKEIALVKNEAKAQVTQAQARAQKAKRTATLATRSVGRAMPESQPAKPIRTGRDVEDAVISGTLADLKAG